MRLRKLTLAASSCTAPREALCGGIPGSFLDHWVVLGAMLWALSPKIDKVSERLTFEYPHEGPCVVTGGIPLNTGVRRP